MTRMIVDMFDFLSAVAEGFFWIGIAIILFCVVGFGLVMLGAFMLSALVAAL